MNTTAKKQEQQCFRAMPLVPPPQQQPRGPTNAPAQQGSTERTVALLTSGLIDIDGCTPEGWTPLVLAAKKGYSRVVRILGADVSVADMEASIYALFRSCQNGHIAVTKMLVMADADVEARNWQGMTPLHKAAQKGHVGVMKVLLEAGANPNSRAPDGETPLKTAAAEGYLGAVKILMSAGADPLAMCVVRASDGMDMVFVALDSAAGCGRLDVVRELLQRVGIEGCGGKSGGVAALEVAAAKKHLDIMVMLTNAGVVDPGRALVFAASVGGESYVKLLLRQREGKADGMRDYAHNSRHYRDRTPLICSILVCRPFCPRVVRLLVDAGADPASPVRCTDLGGNVINETPLALAVRSLGEKTVNRKPATDK